MQITSRASHKIKGRKMEKPKTTKRMGRPLTYTLSDIEAVQNLHETYGWGCLRISRKLGMARGMVSRILKKLHENSTNLQVQSGEDTNKITNIALKSNLIPELKQVLIDDRIASLEKAKKIIDDEIQRLKRYSLQNLDRTLDIK